MVFSEAKDDGIDLPRFPDKEKEDEVDDAGEEARQHERDSLTCFIAFTSMTTLK